MGIIKGSSHKLPSEVEVREAILEFENSNVEKNNKEN